MKIFFVKSHKKGNLLMKLDTNAFKKYLDINSAIDTAKGSVNEISLSAVETRSLTSLKENFQQLFDDGIITENEFNSIFSDATIAELRPYKGRLVGLVDEDMGIVSKDYFSDIVSYIIGWKLPSISTKVAWGHAKEFVDTLGFDTSTLLDVKAILSLDVFLANNYDLVLETEINRKYSTARFPVFVKTHYVEDGTEDTYESYSFIEFHLDNVDITVPELKQIVDKKLAEVGKLDETIFEKNSVFDGMYDIHYWDLLESLKKNITRLDLSDDYTEYGKLHTLPLFESRIVVEPTCEDEE